MDCTKDPAEKYIENPYSFIYIENGIAYITTNYRVLVENNWIDDLKFMSNCIYGKHIQRFSFRIVCSRAIANEFVRHRGFSFSQESTRYCNYNKNKFNNEITFIDSESLKDTNDFVRFLIHCSFKISEIVYKVLDVLIELLENIKYSDIPQQLFQLAIIKICSFEGSSIDVEKKDLLATSTTTNQLEIKAKKANVDFSTSQYRDITDEYFASPNLDQLKNTTPLETNEQIIPNVVLPNKEHETKTILADFSNQKIADAFQDISDNTSSTSILNKSINHTIEKKLNDYQEDLDTSLLNLNEDSTNENIIDQTTELLNISHEKDGSAQEINESLLRGYDTNKQIFDTNEFYPNKNQNETQNLTNNKSINDSETETKEFNFNQNDKKTNTTQLNQATNLSKQNIINLFLLAKKDTFEIFKKKLEKASCDATEEYDVYSVLIKEVRFVSSSNDYILVSSKED